MNYSILLTPTINADFTGGYHKMIEYLKSGSAKKVAHLKNEVAIQGSISFYVNRVC